MLFSTLPMLMGTWICTFTCIPIKQQIFLNYKKIKFALSTAWKLYVEMFGSIKNPNSYGCSKISGRVLIISWRAAGKTEIPISNGRPLKPVLLAFVSRSRGKCLTSEEEQASYWCTGAEAWLIQACET